MQRSFFVCIHFCFLAPRRKFVLQTEISGNIFNYLSLPPFLVSISSPLTYHVLKKLFVTQEIGQLGIY